MTELEFDVAIIGGGPAGLAAALSAYGQGAKRVAILERDFRLGGILEQCIHTGFGLRYFDEELSGPEYVDRFIKRIKGTDIRVFLNTMVLRIDQDKKEIEAVNPKDGGIRIQAKAIVLAMGCREKTRFQIVVPGTRPAGVFTAGSAQRFINIQNYRVGNRIVIVGSGDIGMIMARRMTLEGAKVEAVVEIMPYLAGLTRNRVQCLDDFGIPLYLGHTVTCIEGQNRVSGVKVAKVDENMQPIQETEFEIPCDTVLFSVGLIPENEISKGCGVRLDPVTNGPVVDSDMMTNVPGIFACGNVVHVNDLVDNVTEESELAGKSAAKYALGTLKEDGEIAVSAGENVRYVVPKKISPENAEGSIKVYFRVKNPQENVFIQALCGEEEIFRRKKQAVNPGEIEMAELPIDRICANGAQGVTVRVAGGQK